MWAVGVFDAHCHPTDIMASMQDIPRMHAQALTVMATRREDQDLVMDAANDYPSHPQGERSIPDRKTIIPAFGWHPWFSHQIYDDRASPGNTDRTAHYKAVLTPTPEDDAFIASLPSPLPLTEYLHSTSTRLDKFPHALVGEIGLDRSFRLPRAGFVPAGDVPPEKTGGSQGDYTPGSREGRPLTPHRVSLEHQKVILKAQLELAGQYRRPVSVHSVQTHGAVFDVLQELWRGYERPSKRQRKQRQSTSQGLGERQADAGQAPQVDSPAPPPFPPRICMHSYSGPPDALTQFLAKSVPADVYFSFSICVNFSTPAAKKAEAVIKAVPDDRILVESDFHCAGERMDELLKEIVLKVCEIKGWALLDGTRQLRRNWEAFVFG